jgi:glyoxylase I family protein
MTRFISLSIALVVLGGCAAAGVLAPSQETAVTARPSSAVMFPALNVLDLQAAEDFYVGVMGMKPTLRIGQAGDDHQEVTLNFSGEMSAPEASLVLNYVASRTEPYVFDGFSRLAFRVPDVRAVVEKVRAAGLEVLDEPRRIEAGGASFMLAFVRDPNGARVELIQPLPSR